MVVDDINIFRAGLGPTKDNAPLVVHTDAVIPDPSPFQRLQPVSRRRTEVSKFARVVKHVQFPGYDASDLAPADSYAQAPLLEEHMHAFAGKGSNGHAENSIPD